MGNGLFGPEQNPQESNQSIEQVIGGEGSNQVRTEQGGQPGSVGNEPGNGGIGDRGENFRPDNRNPEPVDFNVDLDEGNQQVPQNEQTNDEEVVNEVNLNDDFDKKAKFVRKKFKDKVEFDKSLNSIAEKLNLDLDSMNIQTTEQAIDTYIQLEQELTRRQGGMQNQNQQMNQPQQQESQLREQVSQLQDQIRFMAQQMQNNMNPNMQPNMNQNMQTQPNGQPRDPNTGQFMPNQQNIQNQQNMQNQNEPDNMVDFADDFDKDKFFEDDNYLNEFLNNKLNKALNQYDKKVEQKLQQQKQQEQMAEQYKKHYQKQANGLKQKYGEQVVKQYGPQIEQVLSQNPHLLNPVMFPNGFEIALQQVAGNNQIMQNQYNNQQNMNNQITQDKRAAKIGRTTNKVRQGNQSSQADREIDMLFEETGSDNAFGL